MFLRAIKPGHRVVAGTKWSPDNDVQHPFWTHMLLHTPNGLLSDLYMDEPDGEFSYNGPEGHYIHSICDAFEVHNTEEDDVGNAIIYHTVEDWLRYHDLPEDEPFYILTEIPA